MISIRKETSELDRMQNLLTAVMASYAQGLRAVAQYAVEIDRSDAETFRKHIEALQAKAEASAHAEDMQAVQASVRGELREYRDKAAEKLLKLRGEINSAVEAMQTFADSVATAGADHEEQLKEALKQLSAVARQGDLPSVQSAVFEVIGRITASVEDMRRNHKMVIATLRDEIRILHQQIEAERKASFLDRATGVWNRQKLDEQVSALMDGVQPFCILMVAVRNLKRIENRYTKTVLEGSMKALLQRLAHMLGEEAAIGRWSEESFAAILTIDPATAIKLSRDATTRLSGLYSVQENGLSQSVPLQAICGVVEHSAGMESHNFHKKLLQMSEALSN